MSANAESSDTDRDDSTEHPVESDGGAWCEHCSRLISSESIIEGDEGALRCPECGGALVLIEEDAPPKAPWHFKVLLVGTVGYLVYRLIWFIGWLRHHA